MAKTMKVLDIHNGPISFCCIKHLNTDLNPYWLYSREWRGGSWHRRLIVKYQDFQSVIYFLNNCSIHGQWQ